MIFKIFKILLIFILFINLQISSCEEAPIVYVKQGSVKGAKERSLRGKDFYSYKSIPFAKPPLGNLRFKDPVPLESWNETSEGINEPPYCMQELMKYQILSKEYRNMSEDCLYLNVFTPEPTSHSNWTVMVYIHGGGFMTGGAVLVPPYVFLDEDIVLVVIQYRLGIFGFLSTEDSVIPGNMGLKDQQLALKWIKENIKSFGGDPESITIFGESAGGASVHYQMLSPGSQGLFRRAILQSGTALCPWAIAENQRKFAEEVGRNFSCSIEQGESYLECMQDVDADALLNSTTTNVIWAQTPNYVLPRVDGEFLPDYPEVLMKQGAYSKIDVISGNVKHEGAFILGILSIDKSYIERLNTNFEEFSPISLSLYDEERPVELATEMFQHYLQRDDVHFNMTDIDQIIELYSDRNFVIGIDVVSNFFAKDDNISLYTYQFNHPGEFSVLDRLPSDVWNNRISHSDELQYLFSGGKYIQDKLRREDDLKMREVILKAWTNFAKTGDPTPLGSNYTWEQASASNFRHLNLIPNPTMESDNFIENRKFWATLNITQNTLLNSASLHNEN